MKITKNYLTGCMEALEALAADLEARPAMSLSELPADKTVIVSIDMNNGFVVKGALASPKVAEIVPATAAFLNRCIEKEYPIAVYSDEHDVTSLELLSYPPHCMKGTAEHDLVPELAHLNELVRPKNSTNAFFAPQPLELDGIENVVVTGCCTDICIYQFAVTLRAWLCQNDRDINVIVPMDLVETYDGPGHNADLMNLTSLASMASNGVTVVSSITD